MSELNLGNFHQRKATLECADNAVVLAMIVEVAGWIANSIEIELIQRE